MLPSAAPPGRTVAAAPSESLRRMVLTTPATASEPYSAEAPSRSTSMRRTAPSGIWLMLDDSRGTAPAEIGCGASGRPLSTTRGLPEPLPGRWLETGSPAEAGGPRVVRWLHERGGRGR